VNRLFWTAATIVIIAALSKAQADGPAAIHSFGWTITADQNRGVLNISQEKLGVVLKDVRINLQDERRLEPLTAWSLEKTGQSVLELHTVHPIAAWSFEITSSAIKISTTCTNAVITAQALATLSRIPARALDPEGFPIDWRGTQEAMLAYGGEETRNQSFLPRKNPEVMYFGLGLVSGSNFHDLFDRPTDILVRFSDQTSLRRSDQDENLLDVTIPVPGNTLIRLIPDYYTKILGMPSYTPMDDTYFKTAPMVWSSWTGYYRDVTENDILQNTDWLAEHLKPYGLEFVQLDDGYDGGKKGEHYWIENWDKTKFPHGPQWLTNYIKSKGMHAGLWLVPNAYAGALAKHPDWYLYSKEDTIVLDYQTPAVDSSNPEVLNFLRTLFTTLDDWGFEYYKFDGEGSLPQAMPELDRRRLYDQSLDPVAVYRNRLKVIRDTIGPGRFIEACPAGMPLNGMGYFNSYFNGNDVFNNWEGMHSVFSSISANAFFNHILAYVTPGEALELGNPMTIQEAKGKRIPPVLNEITTRDDFSAEVGVSDAEARTLVSFTALTGVSYQVGNVMLDLPQTRLQLLQQTMPTMPILPLDLFSRGTQSLDTTFRRVRPDYYIHNYPEILDLKVREKWGTYDVVGFTNWRSEAVTRKISLVDKLGLGSGFSYVAFDFWNQKLLGVFSDQIQIDVEPHDTRVLSFYPVSNHPQLIANSRHISGTYSVADELWDGSKRELSGSVTSIPGETYTLWFYVQNGFRVTNVKAATNQGRTVVTEHAVDGNLLKVSFVGQSEPVTWNVGFAQK
jgi:Melibiase